ncbi:hypothetical protein Poli38472_013586 [Pythium oligandrum]|uniref:Nucleotide-sugar transporter n=1 Tax=Pythium oligandrum TaxID=41045 RepID=A0A8K1FJV9_PYTOL|nr:hypothetical protein Poli38472_013586 [Pythium oligandrum]|eukprot:TMW61123.1 hypothetical protein Poli38472_013586 [Pythium oligandrum]
MTSKTKGYAAMALLAVQFGLQPILYQQFAAQAKYTSVLVIVCEWCKLLVAFAALLSSGEALQVWKTWSFKQSLAASGLPACSYAVQNVLVQIAYQHLPPIVFNLINQTKLLWTALFVHLLIGKRFSFQQCGAMLVLLSAAVLLSLAKGTTKATHDSSGPSMEPLSVERGLLPVIAASVLSGFGGAVTQRSMQLHQRKTALVTMELSFYGMLFLTTPAMYSLLFVSDYGLSSLVFSTSQWFSLFQGWDVFTLIPVLSNALGGLLVGAVTKYVGGVLKSFALVVGIALTAVVESWLTNTALPVDVWVAAALVTLSMFVYNAYPYEEKPKTT